MDELAVAVREGCAALLEAVSRLEVVVKGIDLTAVQPVVNVTVEATGSMRRVVELLALELKRVEVLNG